MDEKLRLWLAQVSSWETFTEYKIPKESSANYEFLPRYDDLYISLMGKAFAHLRNSELPDVDETLNLLASGFQFYRLMNNNLDFEGVNKNKALLLCGLLFYLSGYPAASQVVAADIKIDELNSRVEKFACHFIKRKRSTDSDLDVLLMYYLASGESGYLDNIIDRIKLMLSEDLSENPGLFVFGKLIYLALVRFKKNSIWKLESLYPNRQLRTLIVDMIERHNPIWELFPSQWEAIKNGLLENTTVSLQMPTSAGKTAISEIILFDFCVRNPDKKAIFFAPFRALASELKMGFCRNLARLGLKTKVIYGGGTSTGIESAALSEANIIVATPEKFISIDSMDSTLREQIGLVVCDEGHLLDSEGRGLSYELMLSSFRAAFNPPKIVYISAIVPNIEQIHEWLGGDHTGLVRSSYRPSKIDYAVLVKTGANKFKLDVNPTKPYPVRYQLNDFIRPAEVKYYYEPTQRVRTHTIGSFLQLSVIASLKSCIIGPVALFTTQKKYVHDLATAALETVEALPEFGAGSQCHLVGRSDYASYLQYNLGDNSLLYRLSEIGATYHHGDLPQEIREKAEWAIRSGAVRAIICTNTLAEGVNLPVRTMVIHTIKRYDPILQRPKLIKKRDIKNIVGRSGRAGKAMKGLVILANPNEYYDFKDVIDDSGIEEVSGSLLATMDNLQRHLAGAVVTNELLAQQELEIQKHVDKIDIALATLMNSSSPDVTNVLALIEKTYAYRRTNDVGRAFIRGIFHLRFQIIQPWIDGNAMTLLKESFLSPRQLSLLAQIVRDSIESAPINVDRSNDDQILNYFFDVLLRTLEFEESIRNFNLKHETNIDNRLIKEIAKQWMGGKTYAEISGMLGMPVETVLALISNIFGYDIQGVSKVIVSLVEFMLSSQNLEVELGFGFARFGDCLQYGVSDALELTLMEAGVGDRSIVHTLSGFLRDRTITEFSSRAQVRAFLRRQFNVIAPIMRDSVPKLSFVDFREFIGATAHNENIL